MSAVSEVLDAVEAVIRDDEIDLSDVDTPAKAKEAQLELVAHLRDQLCCDDDDLAPIDLASAVQECLHETGIFALAEPEAKDIAAAAEAIAEVLHERSRALLYVVSRARRVLAISDEGLHDERAFASLRVACDTAMSRVGNPKGVRS